MYKFSCPHYSEGCSKRFRSQSGRTYHVRSAHDNDHNIIHNQKKKEKGLRVGPAPENENLVDDNFNHEPPVEDYFEPLPEIDFPPPAQELENGNTIRSTAPQRNFHPHINGILLFSYFLLSFINRKFTR